MNTKSIGSIGEDYACKYLKKNKYKILERNYRKSYGEIDIIAIKDNILCFVEVKTRNSNCMVRPVLAVNFCKQQHIINTAKVYLRDNNLECYCRFDVCEILLYDDNFKKYSINYIENAFIQES